MTWYKMTTEQVLTALESGRNGLDKALRKVKQEEASKLQKFLHQQNLFKMNFQDKNVLKDDRMVLVHSIEKIDFKRKRDESVEYY